MLKTRVICIILTLLFILDIVFSTDKDKNKSASYRQHRKVHKNSIRYNSRCWPQRCNIICPIQILSTQNLPTTSSGIPSTSSLKTTQITTSTSSLFPTLPPPLNQSILNPTGIVPQVVNGINRYLRNGHPNILRQNRNHLRNSNSKQHIIVKQFILGNRGGKKAYKFRQYAPFGCYVQCEELQTSQQIPAQLPEEGSEPEDGYNDDENEEETDEPYQEGEDKPVEITISPPDRYKPSQFEDLMGLYNSYGGDSILLEDKTKGKSRNKQNKMP